MISFSKREEVWQHSQWQFSWEIERSFTSSETATMFAHSPYKRVRCSIVICKEGNQRAALGIISLLRAR